MLAVVANLERQALGNVGSGGVLGTTLLLGMEVGYQGRYF